MWKIWRRKINEDRDVEDVEEKKKEWKMRRLKGECERVRGDK